MEQDAKMQGSMTGKKKVIFARRALQDAQCKSRSRVFHGDMPILTYSIHCESYQICQVLMDMP